MYIDIPGSRILALLLELSSSSTKFDVGTLSPGGGLSVPVPVPAFFVCVCVGRGTPFAVYNDNSNGNGRQRWSTATEPVDRQKQRCKNGKLARNHQ